MAKENICIPYSNNRKKVIPVKNRILSNYFHKNLNFHKVLKVASNSDCDFNVEIIKGGSVVNYGIMAK